MIVDSSETEICLPPKLHLSAESIDRHGVYIMDAGEAIYMWIGRSVSDQFLQQVFDVRSFQELPDHAVIEFYLVLYLIFNSVLFFLFEIA